MRTVGEKLESLAKAEANESSKDLFARSAYNRFYYASFLITREMLGNFNPDWRRTPHSCVPDILQTTLKKSVQGTLRKAVKKNVITIGEQQRLLNELSIASSELANLLKNAYEVRVIADYEPEQKIVCEGSAISLRDYRLSNASHWHSRASGYCKTIARVWRACGLG